MEKKTIIMLKNTPVDAPYSPAIAYGSLLFISGQVPIEPATGKIVSDEFEEQVEQTFQNLETTLVEAGSSMDKVLKTTAF